MADHEDFNSSDIEIPEPSRNPRYKRRGEQSVREIIEHAHQDRVASKVFEKSLTFGRGAPLTQSVQALWANRFDAMREHSFKQSLDQAPTGETIRRFLFAMAGRIKSNLPMKPAPNLRWLTDGYGHILSYMHFRYADFTMNAHERERTASALDQLVKDGRLHKGRWNKRAWIGYNLTLRLVSCFFADAIHNGCVNFDTIVSRALSMTLMAAAGNRCGDIAQVLGGFEKCFVSYGDITLVIWEPDQVNLVLSPQKRLEQMYSNLVARFVIRFAKGDKDTEGADFIFELAPLNNPDDNLACPVANLLVMALRSGQTHGTTIEQVLQSTFERPDKTVQWRYPKLPVIPAIAKSRRELEFSKPAINGQLLETVKRAGLLAGVTVRMKSHGFRRGHFQEVAHLKKGFGGAASHEVAQAGGHNHKSMTLGITAEYTGGIDRHIYNDRAELSYASPFGPKVVAESYKPKKLTSKEIDAYVKEKSYEWKNKTERDKITRELRLKRQNEWMEQQKENAAPLKNRFGPEGKPSQPLALEIIRQRTQSELNVNKPRATVDFMKPVAHTTLESVSSDMPIDPRLSDVDNVDDDAIALMSLMLGVSTDKHVTDDVDADTALLAEEEDLALQVTPLSDSTEMLHSDTLSHVNNLAAFNVVQIQKFARAWPGKTSEMARYSTSGNSRDNPSPFLYQCQKTEGCGFKYRINDTVLKHELSCTVKTVEDTKKRLNEAPDEKTVVCCGLTIVGRRALKQHRKTHGWTPIACPYGCRNGQVYEARDSYDRHMTSSHGDGTWSDCRCPIFDAAADIAGCSANTLFNSPGKLAYHLQRCHKLVPDDVQQYVKTRKNPVKKAAEEDTTKDHPAKKRCQSRKLAKADV